MPSSLHYFLSTLTNSGSVQTSAGAFCTETSGFGHAVRVAEFLYNPDDGTTISIEKLVNFESRLNRECTDSFSIIVI